MKKNAPLRERDATGHFIKHLVEEYVFVFGLHLNGHLKNLLCVGQASMDTKYQEGLMLVD